ncbi:Hpt domain-containing protein [Arthrobacter sulfonylureivorans]|uniref:Hpt domain-containing protein n=1 Tax=Arthrobacter sulfonylureivorans TaxID=2486855 RepID=UPI0039E658CB
MSTPPQPPPLTDPIAPEPIGSRTESVMMPSGQCQLLPLVDRSVVEELGEGLADQGIAQALVRDFADAWHTRFQCLETALESQDRADSLDAVLSIKTSSMMVGASQLAGFSSQVESHVRAGDYTAATAALPLIDRCGTETVNELRKALDDGDRSVKFAAQAPDGSRLPVP